jgi:hypothetical protein
MRLVPLPRRPFLLAFVVVALTAPADASAQRNQVTLEASVFRGALGYAWRVAERAHIGVEAGFGFPQIDRTLVPEQDARGEPDFEEYLHGALFVRVAPSEHVEMDVGARASIVDVWECGASDCWPVGFLGVYAQPMVGWRRVKFGIRLTGGWAGETAPGRPDGWTGIVALNPLIARVSLAW